MSWTKTACWRSVSFWKLRSRPPSGRSGARVDRGRVRRDDREDRLDEPGHVDHERPVFLVRLGVHLRPAAELADRPAVVVDAPQVVARADRVAVAVLRRLPVALGTGVNVPSSGQDVEAVARQVELADDLRPEQRHDVREDREAEAREDLLGHRRAPEHVAALEHDGLQPRAREIGGADQAVVAAADHDRVVALGHGTLERPRSPRDLGADVRRATAPNALARSSRVRFGKIPHASIGSPFHSAPRRSTGSSKWREWAGYRARPRTPDAHDIEYNAIREAAALIDVSPLYKYRVSGPDACARRPGHHPRRRQDDGRPGLLHAVVRRARQGHRRRHGPPVAEDEFFWTAADPQLRWLELNARGLDVAIEDVTETMAAVALQGPFARGPRGQPTAATASSPTSATSAAGPRRSPARRSTSSRTGYTGDLGTSCGSPPTRRPSGTR